MSHTYTAGKHTIISSGYTNTSSSGTVTLNAGAGTSGQIFTTNTTTGIPYSNMSTSNNLFVTNPFDQVLTVRPADNNCPTVDIKGNLVINGRDLEERLNTIEKMLQIPERDVTLERKHPKIKKLYDEYIAALGKYRTFEAIKGDEDGTA